MFSIFFLTHKNAQCKIRYKYTKIQGLFIALFEK